MYQKLFLIGHLGNDPEMRYTPSGVPVASFRMATSRQWTDASGQRKEKVNWWRISVWNKQAEIVTKYLKKGSKIMLEGEVEEANAYTSKTGELAATVEVKATMIRFLDGRSDDDHDEHPQAATPAPAKAKAAQSEDIPF